jgi:hypothetical protein
MAKVFIFLLLISLVLLIIGLINPQKALFWKKKEQVTRKKAALFYTYTFLISFIGFATTLPHKTAKANAAATETERAYELARSCDTNYRFIHNPDKYLHQKGYFISYLTTKTNKHWFKKPWMEPTYKQIGPSSFDIDKTRKLALAQPLEVLRTMFGRSGDFDNYFLEVAPVGSAERYIISEDNFTLKDVRSCSLLQKAKNGFAALAEYIPPVNSNDRPVDDRDHSWIDVKAGAKIFIIKYSDLDNAIIGEIYDADGSLRIPYAHFKPETLTEIDE